MRTRATTGLFIGILAILLLAWTSCYGVDKTKLTPLRQTTMVQKPAASATFENWNIGQFKATIANSGKGLFMPIPASNTSGEVILRNCWFHDITRDPGVHTEGPWIASDKSAVGLKVTLDDILCENIQGQGCHFEGGSGRLTYRKVVVKNVEAPTQLNIKLMPGCKLWLTFDSCQANVTLDTSHLGTAPISSVVQEVWIMNHQGTMPSFPGVVVHTYQPPPPMPPVDVEALKAQIAALQNELTATKELLKQAVGILTDLRDKLAKAAQ